MIKHPLSRVLFTVFPFASFAALTGCATSQMDTRTHYLNENLAPAAHTPAVPSPRFYAKPAPSGAPAPKKHRRPSPQPAQNSGPEPAMDTSAPGSPMLHLRSTPPTLRDRTGAPIPITPQSEARPAARMHIAAAPAPIASGAPGRNAGSGDFVIEYVNGVITKVSVKKKTGNRALDRKSTDWIRAKFHVRQGASGQSALTLTWREDRDRPTPQFHSI